MFRNLHKAVWLLLSATTAAAAVPQLVSFQGVLTDGSGNPVADGPYTVAFTVYDAASAGTALWAETTAVSTTDGLFSVLLGALHPVPDSAFTSPNRWLGIKVASDPEMVPRQRLVSVAYGYRVSTIDGASGGNITSKVSIGPGHTNTGINSFVAGSSNVALGDEAAVGGGTLNDATGYLSTIAGGYDNTASGTGSFVGGGSTNVASGTFNASVVGGFANQATGQDAAITGGQYNLAAGARSYVGGGSANRARGAYSTIGGGGGEFFADSNSASGTWSAIGGGLRNVATGNNATVGGGRANQALAGGAVVAGGSQNLASGVDATVGGGVFDTASGNNSTVGGGLFNRASGGGSVVSGGNRNIASGVDASIGGGNGNTASGTQSRVGGGFNNQASGHYATVPGGNANRAQGRHSMAAGRRAVAGHYGTFVWADSSVDADFSSSAPNQFLVRADGGVGVGVNLPQRQLHVFKNGTPFVCRFESDALDAAVAEFSNVSNSNIWELGVTGAAGAFGTLASGSMYWHRQGSSAPFLAINSFGQVGIGTITPADRLHTAGDIRVGTGTTGCVKDADGTVIAGICSSDERLKTRIEAFPDMLEQVTRLQPVHFYWKSAEEPERHFGDHQSFGLIAQEVEKIMPELVAEDDEGYLAVRYNKLPLLLLQALKEQQALILEQQSQLEELKVRLSSLEAASQVSRAER